MRKYIVKNKKGWAVVNTDGKKSVKIFKNKKEAIDFAKSLSSTTAIVIQGKDGKFMSYQNVGEQQVRNIPKYVYKYTEITKKTSWVTIALLISLFFIAIGAIFWGLYIGGELNG